MKHPIIRRIAALLIANGATWLILTGAELPAAMTDGPAGSFIPRMTDSLMFYFLPVGIVALPCSAVVAGIGVFLKWRALSLHLLAFGVIGAIPPVLFLTGGYFSFDWRDLNDILDVAKLSSPFGALGAFCGWIYWRIAIKQTAKPPHAIDPA